MGPFASWSAQRNVGEWRHTLERLAAKYRTLVSLQVTREAVRANGGDRFEGDEAAVRRRTFRRLAREFPGALRELDSLPGETLGLRLRQVCEALRDLESDGFEGSPEWIPVVADYHQSLRVALRVRRWLAIRLERGAASIPPTVLQEFAKRLVRLGRMRQRAQIAADVMSSPLQAAGAGQGGCSPLEEDLERLFGLDLRQLELRLQWLLRPPGGQLQSIVWEELQAIHGLGCADLERLIFAS